LNDVLLATLLNVANSLLGLIREMNELTMVGEVIFMMAMLKRFSKINRSAKKIQSSQVLNAISLNRFILLVLRSLDTVLVQFLGQVGNIGVWHDRDVFRQRSGLLPARFSGLSVVVVGALIGVVYLDPDFV
jgi:hypothetical protein